MKVTTHDSYVRDAGFTVRGSMVPVEQVSAVVKLTDRLDHIEATLAEILLSLKNKG